MPDLINRNEVLAVMGVQADYDAHPNSCYRMIRAVKNYPAVRAVSEDVFMDLLNDYAASPTEIALWKMRAGLA